MQAMLENLPDPPHCLRNLVALSVISRCIADDQVKVRNATRKRSVAVPLQLLDHRAQVHRAQVHWVLDFLVIVGEMQRGCIDGAAEGEELGEFEGGEEEVLEEGFLGDGELE